MTTAAPALTFTAYLDRMFEYDRWANARVLEAMSSLGDALPQKPVDRLSHLLICQRMWIRRMRDDADQITDFFPSWPLAKTKAEAQAIGAEMREFIQSHSDAELLEDFVYQSSEGAAFRNRRLDILTQLSQQGCYHRGQIACDLNAMLDKPLVTDYVYYCRQS